jgi:hypothetical protein
MPALVRLLQSFGDLESDLENFFDRNGTTRDPFRQRLSGNELEHQEVLAFELLEPVDRRNPRMIQRSEHLGFAPKTGEPFLVLGELIGKDLDSHVPFELAVPRPIHFPDTASSDELDDLVMRESCSGGE